MEKEGLQTESTIQSIFTFDSDKLKINTAQLKKICEGDDYKNCIEVILFMEKLLSTGKKGLSMRRLIARNVKSFVASEDKKAISQESIESHKSIDSRQESTQQKQGENLQSELNASDKKYIVECMRMLKKQFCQTVYQRKVHSIICILTEKSSQQDFSEERKLAVQIMNLNLDSKKATVEEFLTKGYERIEGQFSSHQALLMFLAKDLMPIVERVMLSIGIREHKEREGFLLKVIRFISQHVVHQFSLQIKINKATLIENRPFSSKIVKLFFENSEKIVLPQLTSILNEALLCPSNIQIQLNLFRILRRMYQLWGAIREGDSSFRLKFKSDSQGDFIKYPLVQCLKNISLYSEPGHEEQVKEAAMFCYKAIHLKTDIELVSQIENSDQLRFLRDSKFYSSKAFAYSDEIHQVYDTYELKLPFWHLCKRIEARGFWSYNILIEKPNSLLIWDFYLSGYDIRFGIYKVDSLNDQCLEENNKSPNRKQILKMEKSSATAQNTEKGFMFLKNGLYKMVFDNRYSSFRAKTIAYSIVHLESLI